MEETGVKDLPPLVRSLVALTPSPVRSAVWWRRLPDGPIRWIGSGGALAPDHGAADLEPAVHPDDRSLLRSRTGHIRTFRILSPDGETRWVRSTPLGEETHGDEPVLVGLIEDITAEVRGDAVRLGTESALQRIAGRANDTTPGVLDQFLDQSLAELGELVAADRAYLFRLGPSGLLDNTHEWCAPGVEPMIAHLRNLDPADFGWIIDRLATGEPQVLAVDQLPDVAATERETLSMQGIESLVLVPLHRRGAFVGFVGVDAVRSRRAWEIRHVVALERFGQILIGLLARNEALSQVEVADHLVRGFADHASDALLLLSPDLAEPLFTNRALERITGIARERWMREGAASMERLLEPEDLPVFHAGVESVRAYAAGELGRLRPDGTLADREYRIRRADGQVRWIRSKLFPVRLDDGELAAIGGLLQDNTAERELIEQLTAALDRAEQASEAKTRFLSRASHELRTPLNAITGFAQLLEHADSDEERRSHLVKIVRAAGVLTALTNDLLDVNSVEVVDESPARAVPLRSLVEEVLAVVEPAASRRQVEVVGRVEIDSMLDQPRLYRQILTNLVSNAIAYNRQGGRVMVEGRADGDDLVLLVRDTGIGIAPELLHRLFVPFDRLGRENSEVAGSGLGLAIVETAVRRLGGTIAVHSEPTGGTEFEVRVPRPVSPTPRVRVVVVEDDDDSRTLLRLALGRLGFDVVAVGTAGEALVAAAEQDVAAYLIDRNLPDLNGEALVARLRAGSTAVPLLVVTADTTEETRRRCLAAGADEVHTKPVDLAALGRALSDRLG
jgi:signal transduction histidine kinase/CheY-like chemotaxis protein